jgi:hypothetical protein
MTLAVILPNAEVCHQRSRPMKGRVGEGRDTEDGKEERTRKEEGRERDGSDERPRLALAALIQVI